MAQTVENRRCLAVHSQVLQLYDEHTFQTLYFSLSSPVSISLFQPLCLSLFQSLSLYDAVYTLSLRCVYVGGSL